MIPTETLPLLDLLRVNPIWGNPLADLLEPSMRILVNLGYGSLTEGWNQGPANVPTSFSFDLLPSNISWDQVNAALTDAWSQGVRPPFATYRIRRTTYSGRSWSRNRFRCCGMQRNASCLISGPCAAVRRAVRWFGDGD